MSTFSTKLSFKCVYILLQIWGPCLYAVLQMWYYCCLVDWYYCVNFLVADGDDTTIYCSETTLDENCKKATSELTKILDWLTVQHLNDQPLPTDCSRFTYADDLCITTQQSDFQHVEQTLELTCQNKDFLPSIWNNLPYQLVNSPSVISFKVQTTIW